VSREILAFYTSTIVPRITEGQGLVRTLLAC
jgi:hypothetical protein